MNWRETSKELPDDEETVLGYFGQTDFPVWPCWYDHDDQDWCQASGDVFPCGPSHWCRLDDVPAPTQPIASRPLAA